MKVTAVTPADLERVFAVPPLARSADGRLDFEQNDRIVRHIREGGVSQLLYGGNAFLYHVTLSDYAALVDWMAAAAGELWMIPSIGPSFGRAMDQAPHVRRHGFPCVMLLPCSDPRDAGGLERGARVIAEAAGCPLILYLKEETNWGPDRDAGLNAIARLVDDEVCTAIKYAVVRQEPARDPYLDALLARVDRRRVVSGLGERPAVAHLERWHLPGFTTGSGCIAPRLSAMMLDACRSADYETASMLREHFLPLEDLRDAWGPARVLHAAVQSAAIAQTGPIPPYVSGLDSRQLHQLEPVAELLVSQNRQSGMGAARPA